MKERFPQLALMAACVALPSIARAESIDIIVTGAALPEAKGDAAYDIVTIERERLGGTASNRVEDALRDVAGLQQFRRSDSRSANATSQGATLRGLGGNASSRALLVLDGVPQSDPFGGWVTWPAFQAIRLSSARDARRRLGHLWLWRAFGDDRAFQSRRRAGRRADWRPEL